MTLSTLHETLDWRDVGGKRSPCRPACAGANDATPVQNCVSGGSRIESESVTSCWETHTKLDILAPLTMSMMHAYMVFQLTNWIREDFSVPSNHREVQGFRDDYSKEKWTSNAGAAAAACDLYALGIECMMGPALQWVMDLAW